MNINDAIKKRRSIRKYQDKPVSHDLIESIFSQAQQAPSNCNTQPWHVAVVSGDAKDAVVERMCADILSGKKPNNYFETVDQSFTGDYRKRQIDCAISLYDSVDIKYEEKDKRQQLMFRNWQFFGAPHGAFFSMPKEMTAVNAVDLGIYLQTVMLLFTANGISSCAQGALAMYTDAAYEIAGVPEENGILFGLSFGYAIEDDPMNNFDVGRADLSTSVSFKR